MSAPGPPFEPVGDDVPETAGEAGVAPVAVAPGDGPVPAVKRQAWKHRTALVLVLAGFFALWELASRHSIVVDPFLVSRPSAVLSSAPDVLRDPQARDALADTAVAMGRAFLYASVAGITLGYLLGSFPMLRDAFYAPALFLVSVPKIIFLPMFLVFFGIGPTTAVYYGAFSGVVYVLINVVAGLDLVEDRHLLVARAYGASFRHRLTDVILPASVPGLFIGLWYGIKNALNGVLILELFVSTGGIGALINFYIGHRRTDQVLFVILVVSVVAILFGSLWARLERRLSRWRPVGSVLDMTAKST